MIAWNDRDMRIAVTPEQFEIGANEILHVPTSARFTTHPGTNEMKGVDWGRTGILLPSNEEYERLEVLRMAQRLLSERLQRR